MSASARPGSAARWIGAAVLLLALGAGGSAPAGGPLAAGGADPAGGPLPSQDPAPERVYEVAFEAKLQPSERLARAVIRLGAGASAVRWIRLDIDSARHTGFRGDGEIERGEGFVRWSPPDGGGTLHYDFHIDRLRTDSSYDARCAERWALFRGDDLFPPARVRVLRGARSHSVLRLRVPAGWSIAVPYERLGRGRYAVSTPRRGFDRPVGWFLVGRLGVLREQIAGGHVAIAGPLRQGVRRQDMLAFLRWTLPSLRDVFGELPPRLLVVSAGDPMWRGGLSGPHSVYLHAERPLISSDGTSPLLHELVHTLMHARTAPGGDWIVEGLAELYSVEVLRRSRTISRRRYQRTLERLAEKGKRALRLDVEVADAAVAARAVGLLRRLGDDVRRATEGRADLDDVVRELVRSGAAIGPEGLREAVEAVVGHVISSPALR